MRAWATLGVAVTTVLFSCSSGQAAAPSFEGLGDLPGGNFKSVAYGVSADGSVVVGASVIDSSAPSGDRWEAFRWENGVMTGLGDLPGGVFESEGFAVSADGSVVVGASVIAYPDLWEGFRWENGLMSALGLPPAIGVSADGSVVVGISGFRWENGAMTTVGDLPGGGSSSSCYDVSADGSVVVGYSSSANGDEAFRWEGGVITALGYLPGASLPGWSAAAGVSADGSVVVGASESQDSGPVWQAFRWENGVMTALGGLPREYFIASMAYDVSVDGSVIVGESRTGQHDRNTAFIWTEATGMLNLREVLTALGLDLSGWHLFEGAGISDDGFTVVGGGHGYSPYGYQGWIATLPPNWVDEVTHDLSVSIAKSDWAGWGTVDLEPNLAKYFIGKAVTLTALPNDGITFSRWRIWDPNYPNDPNYITIDANNPLTLIMTADRQVVAVFRCAPGGGMLPMLSVMLGTLGLLVLIRRRA